MSRDKREERVLVARPGYDDTELHIRMIGGAHPYLWVGNNVDRHLGTLSGRRALRRVANRILKALVKP